MKARISIVFVLVVSLALSLTTSVAVQSQDEEEAEGALGDYAYVADQLGLCIVDVSDPTAPTEVGFYEAPGMAQRVTVAGDYAYVADAFAGLRIVDISDPAAPTEVGFYDTPRQAHGVAVVGDYAYIADTRSLRIVDVSDPAAPTEASFLDKGSAHGVVVAGDYAYLSDLNGLRIVDVSDSAAPTETSFYDTPGHVRGVVVVGDYVYFADAWESGPTWLHIINVSDLAAPTKVCSYETPGRAKDVAVAGDYAYVAAEHKGLRIMDVSDRAAPTEVGFYEAPWEARSVVVAGDYAYVAAGDSGLRVINVSDPTAPTEEGFYFVQGYAWDVAVQSQGQEEAEGVEERPEDSSSCQIKFASQYAFEDFPTTVYTGQPAPVDFTSNPEKKLFITRITEGAQKGPNFAGHYTFIFWGCGTECQNSVVVDTFNGKIYEGLVAERGFDFKINSNLLIVNPPDESGYYDQYCGCTYCAPRVYLWQDGAFKKLEPKVSYAEAIRMIRDLPETQGYLESVEGGRVDARLDASGKSWVVRVYQIVKETGHTATANRYYVDKETGQITKEFSY